MKHNIFWNSEQNRLRTGWRVVIQFILFVAVLLGESIFIDVFGTGWLSILVANLIYLAGGLGLSWLMARFIDRRPYVDYGFHLDRNWWLDLGFGLTLGAAIMTGVFLSMRGAGWLTITKTATTNLGLPFSLAFFLKVVTFTIVAINEELTFRGYQLKNLAEGFTNKTINPQPTIVHTRTINPPSGPKAPPVHIFGPVCWMEKRCVVGRLPLTANPYTVPSNRFQVRWSPIDTPNSPVSR